MGLMKRFTSLALGAAALSAVAFAGPAEAFEPTKPIDFVIMAGAGGGADQIARFCSRLPKRRR
jgi:putative tricarboxylic transport membrane protein